MPRPTQYFRVVRRGKYFRLTHTPSGDYIQQHLCDFMMHRDAIACRNRVLAAAPDWNWADPNLFNEMPCDVFDRVWAAIYGNRRTA